MVISKCVIRSNWALNTIIFTASSIYLVLNKIILSFLFFLVLFLGNEVFSLARRPVLMSNTLLPLLHHLSFELHSLPHFFAVLVPDVPESHEPNKITQALVCHDAQI